MSRWRRLQRKHLDLARSDRGMFTVDQIPRSPDVAYRWILQYRGMEFGLRQRKKIPSRLAWSRFTTQLPWCTLLASDWEDTPVIDRAVTLIHETVHAYQQRCDGPVRFLLRYASAKWRLAYEIQAYRQTIRTWKRFGRSDSALRGYARRVAESISKSYRLRRLRGVRSLVIEILNEEI